MKFSIATAFLLGALDYSNAGGQKSAKQRNSGFDVSLESCVDCLDDIDDARDCLRECHNAEYRDPNTNVLLESSLLAACLDNSGDFSVESIDSLVDCCDFSGKDCEDDLEEVQDCLGACLDVCLRDIAVEYVDCIRDETGSRKCELSECLDGLLGDDIEEDAGIGSGSGSGDIFDVRNIANTIDSIEEDDLDDCSLLEDFVDTICDIGDSCCDRCQSDLGTLIDCLVNDIVIPFVAIERNETIRSCPIDTDKCELDKKAIREQRKQNNRALTKEEEELFDRALKLPKRNEGMFNKRNLKREATMKNSERRRLDKTNSTALIEACENKMRMNIIAHNITHATNKYMECVSTSAIQIMIDVDEELSAGARLAQFIALVLAFFGIMFFL
jgi:hypothetical protein